jgi:hypothetical protein
MSESRNQEVEGVADERDVAGAYRAAQALTQVGRMFLSFEQLTIGSLVLAAATLGKARAEAKHNPDGYMSTLLPLLEREMARVTEEGIVGRTNSLNGGEASWDPISDFETRGAAFPSSEG